MQCPNCGKEAEFHSRSGLSFDADTGPYYYACGECSECKTLIDAEDLDRMAEQENQDGKKLSGARCPICHHEAPEADGYTPPIELTRAACGHCGCKDCVTRCDGCHRVWCKDCLLQCLDCGKPLCEECAVRNPNNQHVFHAACAPPGVN